MIIAAANCVRAGGNDAWLAANYHGIRDWMESLLATDITGNGLVKYGLSGNSGSWGEMGFPKLRPSNWWDTIGFGYEDAYGNALTYRALHDMVMMARKLDKTADAARYTKAAEKLRGHLLRPLLQPRDRRSRRLAQRRRQASRLLLPLGQRHRHPLRPRAEKPQANAIMDKLLAKMKEVGYDKFNMGLPGNLITVALPDYVHRTKDGRYGGGVLPDNSDGFQNYENGGATGAFAFFTLAALYDLGRKEDADKILFPMLKTYGECGFEGTRRQRPIERLASLGRHRRGLRRSPHRRLLRSPRRPSATNRDALERRLSPANQLTIPPAVT